MRRVVRRMLDERDFLVLEAETPELALEQARRCDGPIDLLLSDVIMPGMNGRELMDAIRTIYPQIAVLLVSGYASNLIDPDGAGSPIEFLEKPFTQEGLTTRIRELLDASPQAARDPEPRERRG